jgi:hypothetical protein
MDRIAAYFPVGRARGVTLFVEGFFAFVWFGWGQAAPPSWLVVPFGVGIGIGLLIAVVGVVITARSANPLAVARDRAVARRYGITVGVEFASAGAGAVVLGQADLAQWIPVWVCFVVGIHFFPLAGHLEIGSLRTLGALMTAVALGSFLIGLISNVAPSTVTAVGAGLTLLAFAAATLHFGVEVRSPSVPDGRANFVHGESNIRN